MRGGGKAGQGANSKFTQPGRSVKAGCEAHKNRCVKGPIKVKLGPNGRNEVWGVGAVLLLLQGAGSEFICCSQHGIHLLFLKGPGKAVQDMPGPHSVQVS
jgi:hypothetical protein